MEEITLDKPPTYPVDLLQYFQWLVQQVNNAMSVRNYEDAAIYASAAMDHMSHQHFLAFHNIRAYAYAKQGSFTKAIREAEKMIASAPESAAGNLRKGDVLALYGYQHQAIEEYTRGLEKVTTVIPQAQLRKLLKAKRIAIAKTQNCIDFIASLPLEIANDIIERLPQPDHATCLYVSTQWHQRAMGCAASIWNSMELNNSHEGVKILSRARYTGSYTKHLTINTYTETVMNACLENILKGYFNNIQSLKTTGPASRHPFTLFEIVPGLFHSASNLRRIDLDLWITIPNFTLVDILEVCSNLSELAISSVATIDLIAGDFSAAPRPYHKLRNLQLSFSYISPEYVRDILCACPQLRHLALSMCNCTIFTPVYQHGHNLETLTCNVPNEEVQDLERRLSSEQEMKNRITTTAAATTTTTGQQSTTSSTQGLQVLIVRGAATAPASYVLPLIYKNMGTLKILRMDMLLFSERHESLCALYPQFSLNNIVKLTISLTSDVQSFMLDAIQTAPNLRKLYVINPHDTNFLVNAILTRNPMFPLQKFGITYEESYYLEEEVTSRLYRPNNCVQLLTHYGRVSKTLPPSLSSSQPSPSSLKYVCFRRYPGVTNATLEAMEKIETLRHVDFQYLTKVSSSAMRLFFTSKVANRLLKIDLVALEQITSEVVGSLGLLKMVKTIKLQDLPRVGDRGIQALILNQKKISGKLEYLRIRDCTLVTKECILYAKQRIKRLST